MTSNQINDNLISAIEMLAGSMDKNAGITQIIECFIAEINDNHQYIVNYLGNKIKVVPASYEFTYQIKDKVYVLVPNGDYSKTLMIIGPPLNRAV